MTALMPRKFTYDSNSRIAATPHAQVYRGTYEGNRQVAVKRVLLTSENLVLTELNILLDVDNHENVVRYFYSDKDEHFCYIVMELCDTDLERYIKDDNEQSKDLEKILYGAAKGLAHIHDRNIIHRDLKPSNILVTKRSSEWIAKICDFSISKELPQGKTSHTWTNQGTEEYKAPELFSSGGDNNKQDGKPRSRFSRRTDMYSFGLVVFFVFSKGEHLCGDYPENLTNIINGDLVNLHKLKDVPTAESVVLWTTAHNPKDRPTIAEVLRHPLFWDKLKTLDFIKAVSSAFEDRTYKPLEDLKKIIDKDAHGIICSSPATCMKDHSEPAWADWTKSLSSEVLLNIKSRSCNPKSFCDLIRIFRNKLSHWSQLSNKVRSEYGGTIEAFHDYWMSRFPSLAVYLWDKLELTYLTAILDPYYWSSSVRRGRFEEDFLNGVKDGDYTKTAERIIKGVNINCRTSELEKTALCLAGEYGRKDILSFLLNFVASPFEKDGDQRTPVHLAALNGHAEVVKLFLDRDAETNYKDKDNETPLHTASLNGHAEVVKLLLDCGADINCKRKDNWTPLHLASLSGHAEVIKLLLDRGADINCKQEDNYTPLHIASRKGNAEVVKLLLDRGADINCRQKDNLIPLYFASFSGHAEVVKLLLDRGGDFNCKGEDNMTFLHVASLNGHAEVVKLLLDRGGDFNCKQKDICTLLHRASFGGHAEVVKLLLDRGADINYQDGDCGTSLHRASFEGHAKVVKLLLDRGADINCKQEDNWTPLHIASIKGHAEVVKLLLDRGADINCKGKDNWTPLHLVSQKSHAEVVKLLLDRSADINCKLKYNYTPLHIASLMGHAEVVKLLLDRGADINCKQEDNWTPLHIASREGHAEVVKSLLDRGADRDAKTKNNNNALQLASQKGRAEVIELLQNLRR